MKKRKTYEVSVINKTYSKTYLDQTKFYTSDTALELNFQLKEVEYNFDSAEIILLNVDDRSLVNRPVVKSTEGFIYELEDDIVAHYGEWKGQLKFNESSEIYVSSPISFRIENDLSNDRPPKMSDVVSWENLKKYANSLVFDLEQAISKATEDFDSLASTASLNESSRQENEIARQSAESIRIQNEEQRNLTSLEEFIKLQNSIGGKNLYRKTDDWYEAYTTKSKVGDTLVFTATGVSSTVSRAELNFLFSEKGTYTVSARIKSNNLISFKNFANVLLVNEVTVNTQSEWSLISATFNVEDISLKARLRMYIEDANEGDTLEISWTKIEKGSQSSPHTKAPEDYTVVSKDDYYNHVKLMNDFKDNQFDQLKKAVLALGGTI